MRYFKAGSHPSWRWEGVCAVDSSNPNQYTYHPNWPATADDGPNRFNESLEQLLATHSWEELVVDEELELDEGI